MQTIIFIVFLDFFMLYEIFHSLQVKRYTISTYKRDIYELLIGSKEIIKYQKSVIE